jgi:prepilin-type processing-associated H-X9-DG protein
MRPAQDQSGLTGFNQCRMYGSSHSGQFNVAHCDGSVRGISYSVDANTLRWLCNRKDGQSIDPATL